MLYHFRVWCHY